MNHVNNNIFCKVCNTQTKYTVDNFSRYHLKKIHNISVKTYYDNYIKNKVEGICPVCKKETNFINMIQGYNRCCSHECMYKDEDYNQKRRNGINNIDFKSAQIKREITNIEKYGVCNISILDDIQKKINTTCIEKYGKHSLQLDNVKLNREASLQLPECNIKRKDSILRTVDIAKETRKNTLLQKYGVEFTSQINGIPEKSLQTKHIKYGFRKIEELSEFKQYKRLVWKITRKTSNNFIKEGDVCYYSGLKLNNIKYHILSKTIDHKISISFGFRHGILPEEIGNKDNLCLAARKINLVKNYRTEDEFRNSPDFERIINELK